MICVDASLAGKWIFPEEYSEQALSLVDACARPRGRIVAPPLLTVEVTNIIRQRMRSQHIPLTQACDLLGAFLAFPVRLRTLPILHREVLVIAANYGLTAVYD